MPTPLSPVMRIEASDLATWSASLITAAIEGSAETIGRSSSATAAFILEWPDGRAEFDPEAVAGRVNEALAAALAAENGHGEPLKRTD